MKYEKVIIEFSKSFSNEAAIKLLRSNRRHQLLVD